MQFSTKTQTRRTVGSSSDDIHMPGIVQQRSQALNGQRLVFDNNGANHCGDANIVAENRDYTFGGYLGTPAEAGAKLGRGDW